MKSVYIRQFRDHATKILKEKEPVMILRRGEVAGFFIPLTTSSLPLDVRKELFYALSDSVKKAMREKRVTEEHILEGFKKRKKCRR